MNKTIEIGKANPLSPAYCLHKFTLVRRVSMRLQQVLSDSTTPDLGVLYHATRRESVPAILRDGLDPAASAYADEEEQDAATYGWPAPHHFVYLSHNPRIAAGFGDVVLVVRLPVELQRRLVLDRGEFVRAPFVIPPNHLKTHV